MSNYTRSLESFGKPGLDPAIRQRVLRVAGTVYGLIFALGFAALIWIPDAAALQQGSVHLAWAKLPLGLVTCPPIGMLAGWLAARSRWALAYGLIWLAGGVAIAWFAGHIPYDGVSWIASLGDPYPAGRAMYPFSPPAAAFTGIAMAVGALFGFVTGLLQLIVAERAWDRSTASHRLGARSILNLCLCLPFAALFALYADYTIHEPVRRPLVSVAWAIDTALQPGSDLVGNRLAFLDRYRDELTPDYTVYWNTSYSTSDGAVPEAVDVVDVVFDTGLILRCQFISGSAHPDGIVNECLRISQDLHNWMEQIATTGGVRCSDCPVQVDPDVQNWLATALPAMGALRQVTLLQHRGGWLYQRATFDSGHLIDCRFSGAEPITVDLCIEAGQRSSLQGSHVLITSSNSLTAQLRVFRLGTTTIGITRGSGCVA